MTSINTCHPPVDDPLSVQEKQTDSNLCGIKPAKLKNRHNIQAIK